MKWLVDHLNRLQVSEELEGYLLGRGVKEEDIVGFGTKEWEILSDKCPEPIFAEKYGVRGENLKGLLCTPVYTPSGKILGAEFRSFREGKKILQYRTLEANWHANWIALPGTTEMIYGGKDPWIFEGYFDLCPMRHVLPDSPLLGTYRARMSDLHIEYLRRYLRPGSVVNMAYDNDPTGRKATFFALKNLEEAGIRVVERKYILGKDQGEIWDKFGVDGLHEAFDL